MNRSERSDVPFVPSQIAQPEGGGNQAITGLAGVSGAFAPGVAMLMTSALELPARRAVCLHRTSADVMAITEWSIAFARPNLADSRRSPTALAAHGPSPHKRATLE